MDNTEIGNADFGGSKKSKAKIRENLNEVVGHENYTYTTLLTRIVDILALKGEDTSTKIVIKEP